MNESSGGGSSPDNQDNDSKPEQSALMWTLGCLGKVLLVFVVLVLLVFGACLMVIS